MRKWCLVLVLIVCGVITPNAHQRPSLVKGGIVSGRIFSVTRGGDLKPARMATVVLLYSYHSDKAADKDREYMDSADHVWLEDRLNAMTRLTNALTVEGAGWSDSLVCRKRLLTYHEALSATLTWAAEKHKAWQVVSGDANEDGFFKITVPHPGKYTIVAIGEAGFNDAAWENDDVAVNSGMTTTVKLSSPKEACLK
jgi:hypothetical protein